MKPIEFDGVNAHIAKDQTEYLTLPARVSKDGRVTSCWEFSPLERVAISSGKNLYLDTLTFNKPLQPFRLYIFESRHNDGK